jgi:DNA-binding MarR family transcriptional regulator
MFNSAFYDLSQNLQGALYQAAMNWWTQSGQEAPTASNNPLLAARRGYAESSNWFMVQAAEFAPDPLSVTALRQRAVWSSPSIVAALLELLASEGWFDRIGDQYHLTDEGRAIVSALVERRIKLITPLESNLPAELTSQVEALMRRVIELSLNSPTPPGKWSLEHSVRRSPPADAVNVVKIFQYCADFNAYRDDAHMAAFQPQGIEAYVWEAFSQVWQGTATTSEAIYRALNYRGYAREDFRRALDELARRGWIEAADATGDYRVTDAGCAVRDEAERLTDQYFYAAWSSLAAGEAEELHRLMVTLKEQCEALATSNQ